MTNAHDIKGKVRPLQDWVLLAPRPRPALKRGELFRPDNPRDFINCDVLAVGPKCDLRVGDVVYQQAFVEGEFKFTLNGVPCFMDREKHINLKLAAVDKPSARAKKVAR